MRWYQILQVGKLTVLATLSILLLLYKRSPMTKSLLWIAIPPNHIPKALPVKLTRLRSRTG